VAKLGPDAVVLDRHGDELGNADPLLAGELAPELERLRADAQGEPLILRRRRAGRVWRILI
jgi:hypothetical protein